MSTFSISVTVFVVDGTRRSHSPSVAGLLRNGRRNLSRAATVAQTAVIGRADDGRVAEPLSAIGVSIRRRVLNRKMFIFIFFCRQMTSAPFSRPIPIQDYSSDGDTDDE